MATFGAFIITYLAFVLQLGLVPHLAIAQSTPNVLVIVLLGLLFARRPVTAGLVAGFGGLLIDLYSPFRFGLFTLLYIAVYTVADRFLRRFFSEATIVAWVGMVGLVSIATELPALLSTLSIRIYAGNIVYTTLVAAAVYGIIRVVRPRELIRL